MKLRLDADGDRALADVLSKVNEVKGILPRESNDPVVQRTTGTPYALMYIGFNSKTMTPSQISDYLDRVVKPQLQAINGVASAEILGGATFAMRVWLDPDKMASLGITPLDVSNALADNNFTTAAGASEGRLHPAEHQCPDLARESRAVQATSWWRRAATRSSGSARSPPSISDRRISIRHRPSTGSRRCSSASMRRPTPIR